MNHYYLSKYFIDFGMCIYLVWYKDRKRWLHIYKAQTRIRYLGLSVMIMSRFLYIYVPDKKKDAQNQLRMSIQAYLR